jgi:hypothetical protein
MADMANRKQMLKAYVRTSYSTAYGGHASVLRTDGFVRLNRGSNRPISWGCWGVVVFFRVPITRRRPLQYLVVLYSRS